MNDLIAPLSIAFTPRGFVMRQLAKPPSRILPIELIGLIQQFALLCGKNAKVKRYRVRNVARPEVFVMVVKRRDNGTMQPRFNVFIEKWTPTERKAEALSVINQLLQLEIRNEIARILAGLSKEILGYIKAAVHHLSLNVRLH